MGKILIVEDEFIIAQDLRSIVSSLGHAVMGMVKSADEAIEKITKELPDLVLLDINLIGDVKGTDLAVTLRKEYHLNFIYITSFSDPNTLKEMIVTQPLGYILKPFDKRDIWVALELGFSKMHTDVAVQKPIKQEVNVKPQMNIELDATQIIGESNAITNTLNQVEKVAFTDVTVLINGETGTGKELIMEAIQEPYS